jgi:hypothetical protein
LTWTLQIWTLHWKSLNLKIEDKKVTTEISEESEMQQETPRKLEEKVDSASLYPDKETQAHPSSTDLVSWAFEADEVEALEKSDPRHLGNEGIAGFASTPLSLNAVWMIVRKKKKTPSVSQPMVTSKARNPT